MAFFILTIVEGTWWRLLDPPWHHPGRPRWPRNSPGQHRSGLGGGPRCSLATVAALSSAWWQTANAAQAFSCWCA